MRGGLFQNVVWEVRAWTNIIQHSKLSWNNEIQFNFNTKIVDWVDISKGDDGGYLTVLDFIYNYINGFYIGVAVLKFWTKITIQKL